MSLRQKSRRTLAEQQIFGDEEAAQLHAEVASLRELVADLADRVHAQFTTISAHAEIARQQVEFTRDEARADLERTRELVIGLIDQTRKDLASPGAVHVPGMPPGPSVIAYGERLATLEQRMDVIAATVDRCFDRQRELADAMAAILDTFVAERDRQVANLSVA
ncbi:MAG: hypothetical protein AB7Q27_13325 [Acidimicrobiia bacterium]